MYQNRIARSNARPARSRPVCSGAGIVIGAHQPFEGGLDLLSVESVRIHMKDTASFIGLRLRSGADGHNPEALAANSIGIGHDELRLVCRIRIEVQDAACKHVRSNDIDLRSLINAFTFQT